MSGLIRRAIVSAYIIVALVLGGIQVVVALAMWLTGAVPDSAGRLAVLFTGTLLCVMLVGAGWAVKRDRAEGDVR